MRQRLALTPNSRRASRNPNTREAGGHSHLDTPCRLLKDCKVSWQCFRRTFEQIGSARDGKGNQEGRGHS